MGLNTPLRALFLLILLASTPSALSYFIGFNTLPTTSTTRATNLVMPTGFTTYFYGAGLDAKRTGTVTTFTTNFIQVTSTDVSQTGDGGGTHYVNISAIGYGSFSGAYSGNVISPTGFTTYNTAIAGIATNLIYNNNALQAATTGSSGNSLTYTINAGNSMVLLIYAASNAINTVHLPANGGCTLQQNVNLGGFAGAAVANCIAQVTGSFTTSLYASGVGTGGGRTVANSIVAIVFPPYNVVLKDNPTAGTITTNGTTQTSGNVIGVVGSGSLTGNPPSKYVFTGWSADTSTSANIIFASATSAATTMSVQGTAVITANYFGMLSQSATNSTADQGQRELLTAMVSNSGTTPFTYNFLVSNVNTGNVIFSALVSNSQTTNTIAFTLPIEANDIGAVTFTANVVDGGSHVPGAITETITVSQHPSATISANALLDSGQEQLLSTTESGGTGLITIKFFNVSGSSTFNTVADTSVGATTTNLFAVSSPTNGNVFTWNIIALDTGTNTIFAFNSVQTSFTVNTALSAPSTPTTSAQKLDSDQSETVNSVLPSSGTPPYTYSWLVSVNSLAYVAATQCAKNSGSGQLSGNTVSCSISGGTLSTGSYNFELKAADSATLPASATSSASSVITVNSQLTVATAPTLSASSIDANQAEAVTGTLPSTGTGTPPFSYSWQISTNGGSYSTSTQCSVNSGSGQIPGNTVTCSIAGNTLAAGNTYTLKLQVTDSAALAETALSAASSTITVSSQLGAPSAPTPSATKLDVDQSETVTGTIPSTGTSPYTYNWLVSINSGAYNAITPCTSTSGSGQIAGNTVTCSILGSTLTTGDTYNFELKVNDGATSPETATSSASSTISVSSQLTVAAAPLLSVSLIHVEYPVAINGIIPSTGTSPYAYTWHVSVDNGVFAGTTQCTANTGTGQLAGNTVTCSIPGNTLTTGNTYLFALEVTDGATTPEASFSSNSATLSVTPRTPPSMPSISEAKLDVDQVETVTSQIPANHLAPFTYNWFVSDNGGAYVATTQCLVNSGSGQLNGNIVTCSVPGNTLLPANTYNFELHVTDSDMPPDTTISSPSNTITVSTQLTAAASPTLSVSLIHSDDPIAINGIIPSTGTSPYAYTWYISANGGGYSPTTQCAANTGSGQLAGNTVTCSIPSSTLSTGSTYNFELSVTDSATAPEGTFSAASSTLRVTPETPPPNPVVSSTKLDVDQEEVVTSAIPSNHLPPFTYNWLISYNSGVTYLPTMQCSVNSGSGQTNGNTVTCNIAGNTLVPSNTYLFELQVTDSDLPPDTTTSGPSNTVTVSTQLTSAAAPLLSISLIHSDDLIAINGIIPSTGTSPYSYTWYISANGGAYAAATQCTANTGSGQIAGNTVTCSIPSNTLSTGNTYNFELLVDDGATTPQGTFSAASNTLSVTPETPPSTPAISAAKLDVDQAETVTSVIPSNHLAPFTYNWLVSYNSGVTYFPTVQCAKNSGSGQISGNTVTCSIAGNTLVPSNTYLFELQATDSDQPPDTTTSSPSGNVFVANQLTSATKPLISANIIGVDQTETITSNIPFTGTPPYAYSWHVSVNGGALAGATQCVINTGAGQIGGNTITCSIPGNTLSAGDTYNFALEVTDSATATEATFSASSNTITVSSSLISPAAPVPSAPSLDVNQAETVTATIPSTGTSPFTYNWLVSTNSGAYNTITPCTTTSGSGQVSGNTVTCSISAGALTTNDFYYFEIMVTDSSSTPQTATSSASSVITVNSQLTASTTPTISASTLDADQAETLTANVPSTGTPPYAYSWQVSVNGGSYSSSTQCSANSGTGRIAGNTVACAIPGNTLTAGEFYNFKLQVTDSATVTESATSAASSTITVSSPLTAPSAPSVSSTALDVNQPETVTAMMPSTGTSPFTYNWLVSNNGGPYSSTLQCATNTGSGQVSGNTVTCSISGNALTVGHTYNFELQVNDSATSTETETSSASSTVSVSSQLTASSAPSASNSKLDVNQAETITGMMPSTGTSPYSYNWLISINSGAYSATTQCTVNTGFGQISGNTVTCSIPGSTLTAGDIYNFELKVNDGATIPASATSSASSAIAVNSQLSVSATPTLSASALDANQPETVTGTIPSSGIGTAPYDYAWQISVNGGGFAHSTQCTMNTGSGQLSGNTVTCSIPGNTLAAGNTYALRLEVTDSASVTEDAVSSSSGTITVSSQLSAPSAPTLSAAKLDVDQTETVSGTIPSTGSSPFSYSWLVSTNGGASYSTATQCTANTGSGQSSGSTVMCTIPGGTLIVGTPYNFELTVNDGATSLETATSSGSSAIAVNSELTSPAAPSISAASISSAQPETITATIPSTGTSPYSYTWHISVDGDAYAGATQCAVNTGSGQISGNTVTCFITGNTLAAGNTYNFELEVTDSATAPEGVFSSPSGTVTVNAGATSTMPAISAAEVDADQTETVTGLIPSGGSPPFTYNWLISTNSGSYSPTTQCAVNSGSGQASGNTVTCSISGFTLSVGSSYNFELQVTDNTLLTTTSDPSNTVTVNSELTTPAAPVPQEPNLDSDQAESITATIPSTGTPPYSYAWHISENGGGFSGATQCAVNTGSGQLAGNTVTCTIAGNTLTAGNTYNFALEVADGATVPESMFSGSSSTITVSSPLTSPTAPVVEEPLLDSDQAETVTATMPSTGKSPFSYTWLISNNGGAYVAATQCTANTGSGQTSSSMVTCTVPGGTLTSGHTYGFEISVSDGATNPQAATSSASSLVSVSSPLTQAPVPTVSAQVLNVYQPELLTETIPLTAGGTPLYYYHWHESINGGADFHSNLCAMTIGSNQLAGNTVQCVITGNSFVAGDSYTFRFHLLDSATIQEDTLSLFTSSIVVVTPPTATALTPSSSILDAGQPFYYTILISGGEGPFNLNLIKFNGIVASSLSGQSSGSDRISATAPSPGTATYNLTATDTGTTTAYSFNSVSNTVSINTAPTLTSLTPSSTSLTSGQQVTFTVNLAGGTGPFTVSLESEGTVLATASASNGLVTLGPITPPFGTDTYNAVGFDNGVTPSFAFNSTKVSIVVSGGNIGAIGNSGGGLPLTTTSVSSTTSTTSTAILNTSTSTYTTATTTSTTSIPPQQIVNVTGNSTQVSIGLSSSAPSEVNLNNGQVTLFIQSPESGVFNITISNVTTNQTVPALPGYEKLLVMKINITSTLPKKPMVNAFVNIKYDCSLQPSSVVPFTLVNGTWGMISPFSVNASACLVSFNILVDPVVALFELPVTTSVTTVTVPTTTIPQQPAPSYLSVYTIAVILVLIVAVIILILARRRKSKKV